MTDTPETKPEDAPKPSGNQLRKMRSASRFFAVQALYQMEVSDQNVEAVRREFEEHRFGEDFGEYDMAEGDTGLFRKLIADAVDNQAQVDQLTDRALVAKWPLGRIDTTLRALFRAAAAELLFGIAPPKVVITEFVDVAKAFHPEGREPKFVNAVLDHMAREAKPEAF
ncbi:transcription antitermination factor NusB [Halocynthiibacter styelae]|uniref:Transcription antitermination protein NusB n=1 Tax=Halocynthiibacter styelae TaxID=2761955 RepID=A0A8J7IHX4_9RHOB|nr:transcription antitermination factor NusB [Paenihalocynthiibacter styelae]MBI1492563.1 transcription antitermination factor NusB [Paenihalocynthiibacter styelae]